MGKNNNNANDQFQCIVFNNNFSASVLDCPIRGDVTQWKPTEDQWKQVTAQPGKYHFVIAGSDTTTFTTGAYWSGAYDFDVIAPSILNAIADAYIRSDLSARVNDNYGRERFISVGTSREPDGAPDAMRSLLKFDLSHLSTPVKSATLQLTVFSYDNGSDDSEYNIEVHRILQPWTEENGMEDDSFISSIPGSTGTDLANGVAWQNLDGNNEDQPSIDPTIIASATVNQGKDVRGTVVTFDVTSLVQGWRNGRFPNYGIMLVDKSTNNLFRGVRFGSREGDLYADVFADEVQGPRLLINAPILGTSGDDILKGTQGKDTIAGELGNDTIYGNDGNDVLRGDRNECSPGGKTGGHDIIYGGRGGDRMRESLQPHARSTLLHRNQTHNFLNLLSYREET